MVPRPRDPRDRYVVILSRPESVENIGLVARAMKNTGFRSLRVVGRSPVEIACPRTAVHAKEILREASFYSDLRSATADLNVVFASSARVRQNFATLRFDEAISRMSDFPAAAKIGLLFGNERTGLTSAELAASNFRYVIPQASRQPSYNLAAAVLLTLFEIFRRLILKSAGKAETGPMPQGPILATSGGEDDIESPAFPGKSGVSPLPLSRREQEECIRLIIRKLEDGGFIHATNRRHTTERLFDLLGRLAMTDGDRRLLLAMFSGVGKSGLGMPSGGKA